MTITRSGMTPLTIEEIIAQRVTEALAAQEANRVARLKVESQSQNGDEGNNNNGNGNEGRNRNYRNGNPNGGAGRDALVARVSYKDFLNCQPRSFSGTKGVIGLARWFEKIESGFCSSNCPFDSQVKFAACTLLDGSLTWWNSYVQTGTDIAGYTRRFQELTLLCPRMVLEEDDKIERIASSLMDQKVYTYAARSAENKRKFDSNPRDNRAQPPPFKRQNVGGQNVARAYTARSNEKRRYAGSLRYCNKCKLHHEGQCTVKCNNCKKVGQMAKDCKVAVATQAPRAPVPNQRVVTCFGCGGQGHYKSYCPKMKSQNHGNKSGNAEARGRAYAIGGGDANPDSNVVTGSFLLNDRYASMLFDLSADKSLVLTTFSVLLDVIPSPLYVSYAVELAEGRVVETNTILRGYILGLLGHPFDIDLMPVELGSFDVIVGMD
ncbi:putative reverse transcriptase domain-containing protein [Tanacetum coccineum]